MYFQIKSILKNNSYHDLKHSCSFWLCSRFHKNFNLVPEYSSIVGRLVDGHKFMVIT